MCHGSISACIQSGSERGGDAPLESISGNVAHLALYRFQTLSLALSDLDREELQEVTIVVCRGGTRSFGTIEQSTGDVESD